MLPAADIPLNLQNISTFVPSMPKCPVSFRKPGIFVPTLQRLANLEVPPGFEPGNKGFADLRLTAWLWHRVWSGRRDSDSRHPPWQGGTLPLSYYRTFHQVLSLEKQWCGRRDLNSYAVRHRNLNPARLPFRHARPEPILR